MTELERLEQLRGQAEAAAEELVQKAGLRRGQIVVVGCSTSAIAGHLIGSASAPEVGQAVFEGIRMALYSRGIYLAAQCCEHLNRAIITEAKALPEDADIVNVVPSPKPAAASPRRPTGACPPPWRWSTSGRTRAWTSAACSSACT